MTTEQSFGSRQEVREAEALKNRYRAWQQDQSMFERWLELVRSGLAGGIVGAFNVPCFATEGEPYYVQQYLEIDQVRKLLLTDGVDDFRDRYLTPEQVGRIYGPKAAASARAMLSTDRKAELERRRVESERDQRLLIQQAQLQQMQEASKLPQAFGVLAGLAAGTPDFRGEGNSTASAGVEVSVVSVKTRRAIELE